MIKELETSRLILRHFKLTDVDKMAKINTCHDVMKYFPAVYTYDQTLAFIEGVIEKYKRNDLAVYACICKNSGQLIGSVGVTYHDFQSFFTPCYEIGWRLDSSYWNKGYATEAAKEILKYIFIELMINEVVSYAPVTNTPSIRVMQKIGLQFRGEYFRHTLWDLKSPLSKHVLYRLSRNHYLKGYIL
ncbi:GNAT family N-acetyltransferase [Facilibium subflavum]|uniref:GNAT family N-acetyltransferase n=1 Tax=Facilibium subflavum TaxID=2219058 RepID=UPI000E654BE8|nr:GNAT family N-acetyltransferase [Facilibium subflavum]